MGIPLWRRKNFPYSEILDSGETVVQAMHTPLGIEGGNQVRAAGRKGVPTIRLESPRPPAYIPEKGMGSPFSCALSLAKSKWYKLVLGLGDAWRILSSHPPSKELMV